MARINSKALPQLSAKDVTRFWKHVKIGGPTECWPWTALKVGGYGRMTVKQHSVMAHRVAYTITTGEDPVGECVCHECDNPQCCNPAHLHRGSQQDNMAECKLRGRGSKLAGDYHPCARLTSEQVLEIRALRIARTRTLDLAIRFGVSTSNIRSIVRGDSWACVPGAAEIPKTTTAEYTASANYRWAKITPEERSAAAKRRWAKITPEQRTIRANKVWATRRRLEQATAV